MCKGGINKIMGIRIGLLTWNRKLGQHRFKSGINHWEIMMVDLTDLDFKNNAHNAPI